MSDDYQIHIPPSFFALYSDRRGRLTERLDLVRARYEVCEDLANQLVEHVNHRTYQVQGSEHELLRRYHQGLETPEAGVSAPEGRWVVRRLAELLGWDCPELGLPG